MLPLIGAASGALNAGVAGVQNLVEAKKRQEDAKKQALINLGQKFQSTTGGATSFEPPPQIPKTPNFAESVVAPMAQAAVGGALTSGLGGLMGGGSAPSAPMSDPHADYEKSFGAAIAPSIKPAAMPSDDEQDWYLKAGRSALGGQ